MTAEDKKLPGCTCCAAVRSKYPLEYRYRNRLVRLPNSTLNKKLPILACPECDEPLLKNALARAGVGIPDGSPGTIGDPDARS